MAGLQEIDLLLSVHKADVRHRVDELARLVDHAGLHRIAPEMEGALKLLKDLNRLADRDRAVGVLARCVAQLANARVARAGIVPAMRAFLCQFLRDLKDLQLQLRIETLQHCRKVGGHHAAADQGDIRAFDKRGILHDGDLAN